MTDFDSLLDAETEHAIAKKRSLNPKTEDFKPRCIIVGPGGEIAMLPILGWGEDRYRFMNAVSQTAKAAEAQAVMLTTDMRKLEPEAFCEHFGVPIPTRKTIKEFQVNYRRILEDHNNTMANLPRACWSEMIIVAIYGPRVKIAKLIDYTWTDDGTYTFAEPMIVKDEAAQQLQIGIIPAWWN